jgi:acyl phosphate:glycerol-3-phosphate acyltransferase
MTWLIIVLSYLLGSIPTAYLASRLIRGRDIRRMGDANVGAANAYHELGAKAGVMVGLIDAAKGAAAVLIARSLDLSEIWILMAGLAAVAGHNWPVFLGFRGGRGVSTTIGVLFATNLAPMLIMTIPTIIALLLMKSVTKAMAVLFLPLSLLSWWVGLPPLLIGYSILLPVLIGITHYFRVRPLQHFNP